MSYGPRVEYCLINGKPHISVVTAQDKVLHLVDVYASGDDIKEAEAAMREFYSTVKLRLTQDYHPSDGSVLWYKAPFDEPWVGIDAAPEYTHWTPLPKVKL